MSGPLGQGVDEDGLALVRRAPTTRLGGLPIATLDMAATVALMLQAVGGRNRPGRPLYLTSANGEVISRNASDPDFARQLGAADLISADGQPMVVLSRYFAREALPERVATTDLFHEVARAAVARGLSFYMFGASEEENRRAVEKARALHPGLVIAGHSHGYLQGDALRRKIAEIDALAPDILWLALGVPREQAFVEEYGSSMPHVGLIKTSGGLFNFLSGSRARAPAWMQRWCFEWLWRLKEEPRRLLLRYVTTNPHAVWLLVTRSGSAGEIAGSLRRAARRLVPCPARRACGLLSRPASRETAFVDLPDRDARPR